MVNSETVQPFHLDQKFLIVDTENAKNPNKNLLDIFSIILNVGLFSVNVLIKDQQRALWSIHFYTPYAHDCFGFRVTEIGTFLPQNYTNPLNISGKKLFPAKIFKFHGCSLFIATFPIPPFVIVQQSENGTDQLTYDGIDIIIVNQISKNLNLFPKYIQSSDVNKRGMIFKNGTATGALGMVNKW